MAKEILIINIGFEELTILLELKDTLQYGIK